MTSLAFEDDFDLQEEIRAKTQGVHIKFWRKLVPDEKASRERGVPTYREVSYASIQQAGDGSGPLHHPAERILQRLVVNEQDYWLAPKDLFPRQWAAFQRSEGGEQFVGMPIDQFPTIDAATAQTLRDLNVLSVEQLAQFGDEELYRLGPEGESLRRRARVYLDRSQELTDADRQAQVVKDLQRQVDQLTRERDVQDVDDSAEADGDLAAQFDGFEEQDLKAYLDDHNVKIDGRWSLFRLRQEAMAVARQVSEAA